MVITPVYASAPTSSFVNVKLRLVWKHQFQFAGYYIAQQKGFYARRGLKVDIVEYDPTVNNIDAVISGETDFAVGRSSIIIDRVNNNNIVALLAAFQHSPFMLLTRAFTGIEKPADLQGKRIMLTQDAANSGELIAMLLKFGLTKEDYIQQPHSYNVDDLIDNNTDALSSYISNEPYKMIQQGLAFNILHPADYGFDMYSDILFTSSDYIKNNPTQVADFYEASIEGWKYAFANIEETVSIIHKLYNSQNRSREALLYEAQELKKLAFDERNNFGTLLPYRFRSMAQIYLLAGIIDKPPDLDGFIYKPPAGRLNLTYEELQYIKDKKVLNVCVQKNWLPYEQVDGKQYRGILADFTHLIRDRTGLSINPVPTESSQQSLTLTLQGICDMTSTATSQTDSSQFFLFSDGYINIPQVYVSRNPVKDINQLEGWVAIVPGSVNYNKLLTSNKHFSFVDATSTQDALKMLQQGKVDGLIGSLAHLRQAIADEKLSNLNLTEYNIKNWQTSFAMNQHHQVLQSILNKTLQLITAEDRDKIMSRWISSTPQQGLTDRTYIILIALITLFAVFVLYRYITAIIRNKLLKEISETDQLTNISNRRKTLQDIQRLIDLSIRYGHIFSILYFDIDDFKLINDQYGHESGDRVLIELSALIKKQIRKTDYFGRWGGEEFILCSPESDLDDVNKMAVLLKDKIHQHDFKLNRKVSCSFGVTSYQREETLDNLISRADRAMYQAKKQGKDCIYILQPEK